MLNTVLKYLKHFTEESAARIKKKDTREQSNFVKFVVSKEWEVARNNLYWVGYTV